MKTLVLLFFAFVALANAAEKYTTEYDNLNIQEILSNKRLLRGYTNCFLDKGPCSPAGAFVKKILPEILATNCEKCSRKQKGMGEAFVRYLLDNEPEIWTELNKKYDPTGELKNKYREKAEREGIKL